MGAWESGQVPDNGMEVVIVQLYKEKGSKIYCKNDIEKVSLTLLARCIIE